MTKPTLFLIYGLPCSGKTTLAKQLEHDRLALRFTPDEWISRIGIDGYDEQKRFAIETIQIEIAIKCLSLGTNVILDFGFWSRAERDALKKQAYALNALVEIHYLNVPISELLNRLKARNATLPEHTFHVTEPQLLTWSKIFEIPSKDEF